MTGTAAIAGHPSRAALFDAVAADRAGPEAGRLLHLTHAEDPAVRRTALDLLHSLCLGGGGPWPEAAAAALYGLTDPAAAVRLVAAPLLVRAGRPDLALGALDGSADLPIAPEVRTALALALRGSVAARRTDPQPSVRFLALLETLRRAPEEEWPALDAALSADVREAAPELPDLGTSWGSVLRRLGRERHAYVLVERLLADPATRDVGADLAQAVCHAWRAAPVELVPSLARYGAEPLSPAFSRALTTASLSEAARRRHGALLSARGFPPRVKFCRGERKRKSYSAESAAEALAALPVGVGRLSAAPEIFGALLDAGPLSFRQAAQLYNLTFRWPGRMQAACAPLWLRHAGPSALSRLLGVMTPMLDDYIRGEEYLAALAPMGDAARSALPAVTALIDRRTRIPVNDTTEDAEMARDEALLAAALATRRALTYAPDAPGRPSTPGTTRPSVPAPR
ncbi:hypothetical protein ACWCPT_23485 [Streptomyces sp. NPDC002308]